MERAVNILAISFIGQQMIDEKFIINLAVVDVFLIFIFIIYSVYIAVYSNNKLEKIINREDRISAANNGGIIVKLFFAGEYSMQFILISVLKSINKLPKKSRRLILELEKVDIITKFKYILFLFGQVLCVLITAFVYFKGKSMGI